MEELDRLLGQAAKGDTEAYGLVYDLLFDDLFKYINWNVASTQDAQDLTAEVFLRALKALDRFEAARSTARSWLFTIARNLVIDHHRRRARRPESPLEIESEPVSNEHLERAVETEAASEAVRAALGELNEEQRQVLTMKFFSNMSNAEVAAVMGKREGAINAMQYRALHRMGKILEKRGWNPEAGD